MSKLFIKPLGEGSRKFYTICYDADYGKTRAYKENWDPVHFKTEAEAQAKLDAIETERVRADEARPFSMEEAELFVSKQEWIFAATCEKTDPHEYIVKTKLKESEQKKFERFVATAKLNLVSEAHRGRLNKIFILRDHYYWFSEPYENKAAHIICRADINFIELKDGLYQYNIQRVNEAIKKREEWKKKLQEDINQRSRTASISYKHNKDGVLEAYKDGVYVGDIITMADLIADRTVWIGDKKIENYQPVPLLLLDKEHTSRFPIIMTDVINQQIINSMKPLSIVLGKDSSGRPLIVDISKLPHVLIAGRDNNGILMCLNSIIMSVLCSLSPKDVRMIVIDPTIFPLTLYNGIPHLLTQVISSVDYSFGVLMWIVDEVERRRSLIKEGNYKRIECYNDNKNERGKLPRILVVINSFDSIIIRNKSAFETLIKSITDYGCETGVHVIMTTFKPVPDVITNVIKQCFPTKICSAVFSSDESNLVLDDKCALDLLDSGDMIYAPLSYPHPMRFQYATVTDVEIERACEFLKSNYGNNYDNGLSIIAKSPVDTERLLTFEELGRVKKLNSSNDVLLESAVDVIIKTGIAGVSILQRRLGIGYIRAANLIDDIENLGYIGPFKGSKPRDILVSKEEWEEIKKRGETELGNPLGY